MKATYGNIVSAPEFVNGHIKKHSYCPPRQLSAVLRELYELSLDKEYRFDVWNIITSLRGSDGGDYDLKALTTARIRGFLGLGELDFEGMTRCAPLTEKELNERDELLKQASPHFEIHFRDAVISIRYIYGYDLGNEVFREPEKEPF